MRARCPCGRSSQGDTCRRCIDAHGEGLPPGRWINNGYGVRRFVPYGTPGPPPPPVCGSEPGWEAHLRHGQTPCGPCVTAREMCEEIRQARAEKAARLAAVNDEREEAA